MLRAFPLTAILIASLAAPATADEVVILQKARQFQPVSAEIKAGDTLVFVNQDSVGHNVKTDSGPDSFDLKLQSPREERRVVLAKPGTYEIGCEIHPLMKLQVTVK